jgi:trimeric autotransporter adhesin
MAMAKDRARTALRPTIISLAVASCFSASAALANPTGASVVRGTAAIHQAGNLLQITNSPNAIINWQSFSIGANEITRFLQQSSSSAVLNRVTTQNPSQILGSLQSKLLDGVTTGGRVFLINPNGILFGAGAQIDVGGLVASTLRMTDDDFLAGRMRFGDGLGKSVVNDGSIATGPGGSVYLIGSGVTNNGIIRSPQGDVVLAAGKSVELVSPGTPNLRVEIAATDN